MPENLNPNPIVPIPVDTQASDRNFAPSPVPAPKPFPFLAFLLLILLAVATTIAIYLFLQVRTLTLEKTAPSPTPIPTASADPTADWQTYSNDQLKISFKYPPNINGLPTSIHSSQSNPNVISVGTGEADVINFEMTRLPNTTVDDWYSKAYFSTTQNLSSLPALLSGPTVDGLPSRKQVFNMEVFGPMEYVFVQKDTDVYQFVYQPNSGDIPSQILSTFKFTTIDNMQTNESIISQSVTAYLVSMGLSKEEIKINTITRWENPPDVYSVSYTSSQKLESEGTYVVIGKVNGDWVIPKAGDSIRCSWIESAGLDEATVAFMDPACHDIQFSN